MSSRVLRNFSVGWRLCRLVFALFQLDVYLKKLYEMVFLLIVNVEIKNIMKFLVLK